MNDKNRPVIILNTVFLVLLAGCLLAGLVAMLFFPHDKNEYENRYAAGGEHDPVPVTVAAFRDGSFQSAVENALADQLPYAERMKKSYNDATSGLTAKMIPVLLRAKEEEPVPIGPTDVPPFDPAEPDDPEPVDPEKHLPLPAVAEDPRAYTDAKTADGRINLSNMDPADEVALYVALSNNVFLFRSHLVYGQQYLQFVTDSLYERAAERNAITFAHPEAEYYAYYVEKDSDINLESGVKSEISDYALSMLAIPAERKNIFRVNGYEDIDAYFYKVDHHWNGFGSYEGYRQLLAMLLPEAEPVLPAAVKTAGLLNGSKAIGSAAVYTEELRAYDFDFPELTVEVNGEPMPDNGYLANYIAKEANNPGGGEYTNYANCYGYDNGETVIRNASADGGTLLVIGESYDNALLKLLACHFAEVRAIDLRNYEAQIGWPFRYGAYVAEHPAEKVLFIGAMEYWYSSAFALAD